MNDKIRVLSIPSDQFGVGHYRNIWVGQEIQRRHSDEFEVDIRLQQAVTDDDIGKFDIVHFHRRINEPETTINWIKRFQASGAIVIDDMDDFWTPFHGHPVRELVIKNNVHTQMLDAARASNYVTTTTDIYAKHISEKANKNVKVIPNAIDQTLKMWQDKTQPSDRVRIAWIGGSSHERDLDKLKGTFNKLFSDPDVKDKIQIVNSGRS